MRGQERVRLLPDRLEPQAAACFAVATQRLAKAVGDSSCGIDQAVVFRVVRDDGGYESFIGLNRQ